MLLVIWLLVCSSGPRREGTLCQTTLSIKGDSDVRPSPECLDKCLTSTACELTAVAPCQTKALTHPQTWIHADMDTRRHGYTQTLDADKHGDIDTSILTCMRTYMDTYLTPLRNTVFFVNFNELYTMQDNVRV